MGLYLWVCRHDVPVAMGSPAQLIKHFSLALGYRSELRSLTFHYLTGISQTTNQTSECVGACSNAELSGHAVKNGRLPNPTSACPGPDGDARC